MADLELIEKLKITFCSFLVLTGCSTIRGSGNTEAIGEFHSSFFDKTRAPASMSPPSELAEGTSESIDPLHMQTKADYFFALGESLSFDGKHSQAVEAFKSVMIYDTKSSKVPLRISAEYLKLGMSSEALEYSELAIKNDPKSVDAHLLLGGIYTALKTYSKALEEYQKVIQFDPNNLEAPLYIGAVYAEQNQPDKAAGYFEMLTKNDQYMTPHVAYFYLGRVRAEQKGEKYQKAAEAAYKKAISLKSDYTDAVLALGSLYIQSHREAKFVELYINFQKEFGPNAKLAEALAQYYLENDKYEQAYEQLALLENLVDENLNIKVRMALVLIEQKKFEPAIGKLQEILKIVPESDKIRFYLAAVYEESKKYDEAIAQFRKVPTVSQFYGDSILHAAYLLRQMKKTGEAISMVEEGLKFREDIPQMYSLYASLMDEKQEYPRAKEILETGSKKFPENVQIQFFLGTLQDRLGDKNQVIAQMKKVITMDPNHVQGLNYLAFTYAELGLNLDEAEGYIKRALKFEPNDGYILDTYGWILHKKGKIRDALLVLEKAYEKMPREAIIAEHLGDAYYKLSMTGKAKDMYEKALTLESDDQRATEIKEKILGLDNPKFHSEANRKPASLPSGGE